MVLEKRGISISKYLFAYRWRIVRNKIKYYPPLSVVQIFSFFFRERSVEEVMTISYTILCTVTRYFKPYFLLIKITQIWPCKDESNRNGQ